MPCSMLVVFHSGSVRLLNAAPASPCAQARQSIADTKKRIAESEKRVDSKLGEFVDKKYWCVGPTRLLAFTLLLGGAPCCTDAAAPSGCHAVHP